MQPVVETLAGLERRIELSVALADIEKKVQAELKRVARTAKAPGFRPGKVPMSMLEKSHAPSIRYDVINQTVGQLLDEQLTLTGLRVAGSPTLEGKTDGVPEDTLAFLATFEVYPDVALPDLATLSVQRAVCPVTDAEVQRTLDVLREQRAEYEEVADRAAEKGDRVKLDFLGTLEGVPFEGGTATDFEFDLGKGRMLPEFETAAMGMKAGEVKVFPLTFPADYNGKDVAGKTVEFTITVKSIAKPNLPEVNADFAKALGQPEGDVEKLLADVRGNIEREVSGRVMAKTKASVMDALVATAQFDIPKALLESETQSRIKLAREQLKERGMPNADTFPIPPDAFTEEATRRVKLGLMISELIKVAGLQAKPEQVRTRIETFAQGYEQPAQVVSYYLSDRQRRAEIEAIVLEDNVVDHILSQAQVAEDNVNFDQIMGNT
ncbi:MAG: trigger factor [Burkholderiaceae bacterium]|nr:trigger factor [Burkholderiaceae bacterium]